MTHQEFIHAYRQGDIKVHINPALAGKYMSARLLLPVVITPIIGVGTALAIWGFIWVGVSLVLAGFLLNRFIKYSAPSYLLSQALEDESVYQQLIHSNIMTVDKQ